jgi:hypothetical protein
VATVSSGLASKLVATVFQFGPQNQQLWFGDLCLKINAMTSWFEPQNQTGYGLSVTLQNRREGDGVGRALRSSSLFRVEASRARVSQSDIKIGGGTTAIGARGTMVKVMSRSNQRRMDRCYGLHRILLPLICHFLCISP